MTPNPGGLLGPFAPGDNPLIWTAKRSGWHAVQSIIYGERQGRLVCLAAKYYHGYDKKGSTISLEIQRKPSKGSMGFARQGWRHPLWIDVFAERHLKYRSIDTLGGRP